MYVGVLSVLIGITLGTVIGIVSAYVGDCSTWLSSGWWMR